MILEDKEKINDSFLSLTPAWSRLGGRHAGCSSARSITQQLSNLPAMLASRLTRTFCVLSGKVLNEQAFVTFSASNFLF
jgi:hypothetical protein